VTKKATTRSGYTASTLVNTELIGLLMEYGADIKAKIGGYESTWQTFLADDQRRPTGRKVTVASFFARLLFEASIQLQEK
jgi:hypothetical protein